MAPKFLLPSSCQSLRGRSNNPLCKAWCHNITMATISLKRGVTNFIWKINQPQWQFIYFLWQAAQIHTRSLIIFQCSFPLNKILIKTIFFPNQNHKPSISRSFCWKYPFITCTKNFLKIPCSRWSFLILVLSYLIFLLSIRLPTDLCLIKVSWEIGCEMSAK